MKKNPTNGTRCTIGNTQRIFYNGYWIRYYAPPDDTLSNRKFLIDGLTRRAFHHTESGINTPGKHLDDARRNYESETDPKRKRVNAAMLAGALFNRATDLFTSIVDLGEQGVEVTRSNALMKQCSACFREALELGKQVKHYSGEEGIDELWGEPFKVFTLPPAIFYESRYIKISQTMRDIELISQTIIATFKTSKALQGLSKKINVFAEAAKLKCETMKTDPCFFKVWPAFVAAAEDIESFKAKIPQDAGALDRYRCQEGLALICQGMQLIRYIASARVPMPDSTRYYIERCQAYKPPF